MDIVVQAHTGAEKTTVGFQNICRWTGKTKYTKGNVTIYILRAYRSDIGMSDSRNLSIYYQRFGIWTLFMNV